MSGREHDKSDDPRRQCNPVSGGSEGWLNVCCGNRRVWTRHAQCGRIPDCVRLHSLTRVLLTAERECVGTGIECAVRLAQYEQV
ncbi:hypothetical protein E2C01_002518 [Portunus trituberculatus]|uniref:Uncharacterized protein n=1 Tax=Portunus trituberculatus TaxID=210409 RepID=A0A5B7CKL1_PORTR|nr:hypothetical protein [Portunus trituberculatus]